MKTFDHDALEKKWQKKWEEQQLYSTPDHVEGKDNAYTLVEFPYPSGNLHIGHWYAFAVPDIYARYVRMNGKNVLYPIGFDAFGLPAENAAIKRGLDPRKWTYDNIDFMTGQLKSMGNSFDWSRKVVTCDPEYYKWTQWLFLQLYEKGLAYKKKGTVPWCDSCKTVLANEQIVSGACERCSTQVVQKNLDQWYFKITEYAERLLADLDDLDWPEEIKQAQREWIGKSNGALLEFGIKNDELRINVFTTRPDTLYGVTYVVLAPEHELVAQLLEHKESGIENHEEVRAYVEKTKQKKELERKEGKEKTGVELKGVKAINPANGEEVPVWIADYVLASYGTGAVMAVPAHDERDWEFAKKYGLKVSKVIAPPALGASMRDAEGLGVTFVSVRTVVSPETCWIRGGDLLHSGPFTGMSSEEVMEKITAHAGGTMTTQYRLRDWLLSRQRYWGAPIPVVYDPEGTPHPVPPEHLPWTLPNDVDFTPTGEAPLATSKELRERTERLFGKGWTPEVDTMDTFVCSSWYYLRYLDPHNDTEFSPLDKQKAWMPVDRYSGGAEHTTMHLLYSRFFYKALSDLGLVTESEPYVKRMSRGLILGPDGQKMSKSKGNVIDPDEHVARVGADTVKTYLAFIGPYNEVGQYPWDLGGIAGVRRFLERVWNMRESCQATGNPESRTLKAVDLLLHQTIKKVGDDIQAFKFNTAISQMMILVNALEKEDSLPPYAYESLIRLLAPFAPHLTEELWEKLGHTTSIHLESWPTYDENIIMSAHITIAVQVNGKTRATFLTAPDTDKESLLAQAKTLPKVAEWLAGKEIVKEVVVPGRLVNIVHHTL
ncbi:MAG: leucine--tRNA ligase [Candidatus Pacebacteria bacterium]|nr:leucine--tRNA ligase [Candidatus Paceibacterota bacterium]